MAIIYFKTQKGSETWNKMQVLIERSKVGVAQAEKLCKELGATDIYLTNNSSAFNTGLEGFQFEKEPNPKFWKKIKKWDGFYQPRLNHKEGKELAKRISELERVEKSEIGKVIGFNCFFRTPGFALGKKSFGFTIDSDWQHQMPEDCIEITFTEYNAILTD